MASTYSSNLKLELMGTGDQSGTWGNTTNNNLGVLLEQAIVGYTTQVITDGADTILTIANGVTSVARNFILELTGTLTANRTLIVPAIQKAYIIYNNTSGGYSVTVKVSGQTGVTVANGKKAFVYNNGTDIIEVVNAPVNESGAQTLSNKTITGGSINNTPVGNSTPSTGAFTTLSASSTVSGAGFDAYLASPPAIGGTAPAAGAFTTVSATGDGTFSGTGQVKMPVGTTGQRSGSPATGMFRFNSTTGSFEGYNGTNWGSVGGGATGAGGDQVFYLNSQTVTASYTIPSGQNANCVGPITINSGVAVTVPSGSRWVVL